MANGSKYIKDKGSGSNSKYIRNKDDYHSNSRSGDSAEGLSGRARYLEMLEREQAMKDTLEMLEGDSTAAERIAKREAAKKEAAKKEAAKKIAESKGTTKKAAEPLKLSKTGEGSTVPFSSEIEAKPLANEDEDEKVFRKVLIRNIVTCSVLAIIAVVLQIFSFRLPLMPGMARVDLSAIPELLAAISFGPLAGFALVFIKNAIYILIMQSSVFATALSNVILDTVFVGLASIIFARGMFSPMAIERRMMQEMEDPDRVRDERGRMIIKSGLIGALVTTPISYFTSMNIVYPLVFKQFGSYGYNADYYVVIYNDALRALNSHLPAPLNGIITEITSLSQGVLLYNLPITFVKLMLETIFVAIVFKWLTQILFYKPTVDAEDMHQKRKGQQKSSSK